MDHESSGNCGVTLATAYDGYGRSDVAALSFPYNGLDDRAEMVPPARYPAVHLRSGRPRAR